MISIALELAEARDVPAGFARRAGVCHLCQSELVSGQVEYEIEPLEPAPTGQVLLCCSRPRSTLTLDLWPEPNSWHRRRVATSELNGPFWHDWRVDDELESRSLR